MTSPAPSRLLVMGIHPTARGFGWTVLESPFSVFDAGQFESRRRGRKNAHCLDKLSWLLDRVQPETVVLEAFDRGGSIRSERIRTLCLSMVDLVAERGFEFAVYNRADVSATFAATGAKTRDDVAEAVLRHLPALKVHYPGRRRPWNSEDRRLSVFSAAALALTHYQNGAAALLDELRNAA